MRVVYVSGPYRARTIFGVFLNIWKARRVAMELWKRGYAVICPHMNTAFFPQGAAFAGKEEENHINYVRGDIAMINRMIPRYDVIAMLPGWENSEGAIEEFQVAMKRGLLVIYCNSRNRKFEIFNRYLH